MSTVAVLDSDVLIQMLRPGSAVTIADYLCHASSHSLREMSKLTLSGMFNPRHV